MRGLALLCAVPAALGRRGVRLLCFPAVAGSMSRWLAALLLGKRAPHRGHHLFKLTTVSSGQGYR